MSVEILYCPRCDGRTVHNRVRPAGGVGSYPCCRECTAVVEKIDSGEMELVEESA